MRRTAQPAAELVPGQSESLLRELHLVSRDGKLHADSLRKLKQVNHLAQLLAPAVRDVLARFPAAQLLDAGAGNAYLGFVLYELFLRSGEAQLWSVETRPELVARARERAARLGFARMRFVGMPLREAAHAPAAASGAGVEVAGGPGGGEANLPDRIHLVTALHACDTATDDALALAVRRRADYVALVPCCQAEVAAQLKARPPARDPFPLLWAHPIHRREAGAHLTNVIRALVLEAHGYQVTVTELTGWEHSLKNELILGRRVHREHRGARARLRELLAATGVRPQVVRELCPELLGPERDGAATRAGADPDADADTDPDPDADTDTDADADTATDADATLNAAAAPAAGVASVTPDVETDVVVIGAGVIGLAVAAALARLGREVIVLEAELAIGSHTSSRNSEVIHAGFHYAPGSRKARLCVAGRRALYAYAAERGVAFRKTGKLVVAISEAELPTLQAYREKGLRNGVEGLSLLGAAEAHALEPEVTCAGALLSAETGIVDSHGLMQALRRDAEARGALVQLRSPVLSGRIDGRGFLLSVGGESPATVRCAAVINAAGLRAQEVARALQGLDAKHVPPCHYAKGNYFSMSGAHPFRRLVYPVAVPGGLGVHLTLDLAGQARFGPDVEWVPTVEYRVDEARAARFEEAIRRWWPHLPAGALQPAYAGVRPKLGPAGSPDKDFVVQGPAEHGVPGLVNLFGIESPGLTSALPLADEVAALVAPARAQW